MLGQVPQRQTRWSELISRGTSYPQNQQHRSTERVEPGGVGYILIGGSKNICIYKSSHFVLI